MKPSTLTCVFALMTAAPVLAGPIDDVVSLEVLPGWRTADGTHMAGLQISLAPGWKTYWRAPGDGGIPPRFEFSGSGNVASMALHYPVPEVFHQNDMRSIGYSGSVVIPVEFTLDDPNADALMQGQVQIGVCYDICVPVFLPFDAQLLRDSARDPVIVAALLDRPQTAREANVGATSCAIAPSEDGLQVTARISMPSMGAGEVVVMEAGDQQVWVSEPQTWREGGALYARSDMIHVRGGGFALDRSQMRITVLAGGRAVEIDGCSAP